MATTYTIEDIKKYAEERGGWCLSDEYRNMKTKLKWVCANEHYFEKTFEKIKYKNSWCWECRKEELAKERRKYSIKDMMQFANTRNGECISEGFTNTNYKLTWKCEKGHVWDASYETVKKGHWCSECAGNNKKTKEYILEIAKKFNVQWIPSEYQGVKEKMQWRCIKGHVFNKTLDLIQRGSGCPECYEEVRGEKRRMYSIEDIMRVADEKGGRVISKEYKNYNEQLMWECEKGHQFSMKFGHVKDGHWCKVCGYEKVAESRRVYSIVDMKLLAKKYNGECLSERFISTSHPLKWKCANGHYFEKAYGYLQRGQWCSTCGLGLNERKTRFIFENIFSAPFPKTREELGTGLELDGYNKKLRLAFEYEGEQHYYFIKLFHREKEGFLAQKARDEEKRKLCKEQGLNLIEVPYWLETDEEKIDFIFEKIKGLNIDTEVSVPYVKRKMKDFYNISPQLEELKICAMEQGGELLSDTYIASNVKLLWRCKEGHKFWKVPIEVKKGQWCKKCGYELMKRKITIHTIEEMRQIAREHGGECLSEEYINSRSHLTWKCKEGHVFKKNQEKIKAGQWCPKCQQKIKLENIRRKGFEKCLSLAEERGGKLISDTYVSSTSNLKWQCKIGHTFERSRTIVQIGKWCKECF
ncbi:hypothetical protein [Sporosarcina pasteurii]|uniref:Zinc-ribbon domain-containing protein n=1 Tax=Sporosarcina pasteurii TaxID=1474 RepID=A0A380C235_SPOPA|nr:hypothetical protein [Sporosarcina pasteurii]MDS9471545.1 hypothetical protein [Sporosarcina pasteurii]QBQ04839.1 hypothetical protein E2C16_03755 [Sporosarcina pasteurii]SUJ10816.1 Uncharacterised protein [Sporosarcina pasteurii]